ncbi:MAG: DNA ligase D, partial [Novosphingobium sp.]|nr:DNA ligase D [Novosphingobium sp.]
WLLVRMRGKPGEKRENWLLRKIDDAFTGNGDELVQRGLTSVLTGRSMAEIAADKAGAQSLQGKAGRDFDAAMARAARRNARKSAGRKATGGLPPFEPVQLATLVDAVPTGNGWMHEIKFDGYRALVAANGGDVRVHTRSGLDWTEKFAPLAESIRALDLPPCLIDGEIVASDARGNPDFSALQAVLKRGHGQQGTQDRLAFHAFDLLSLDGQNLKALPNIERKERLEALLSGARPPVHVADHVIGAGEKLLSAMCGAGQEGIIAKRVDAPYRGDRTRNWVKVKCTMRQEFVVIGWTASGARGRAFRSLLLAQRQDGELVYKGKVGTGFGADTMADLAARMALLERKTAPADVPRAEARGAHWITPSLVAEIAFAELTGEGRVRHASFIGLRADKRADDVKAEKPGATPRAGTGISITNPDRVIFPESGRTKGELAAYYETVAPLMLPFAANRPVSLVRCPQGRARKCFFQKHDSGSFGPHVHHVPIVEKDGGIDDYLYISDAPGILACVQMGTIEFHGWCAKADDVERPDRMIFDLDPDEGLGFEEVKRAARDIRSRLSGIGLVSFAMLSGGKGVHVIAPLTPGHDWDTHKDFAKRFAEAMSLAEPDRFTAAMSKAKRKDRIFIDWLRNQRGGTAILPYSARARAGAPVAVPVPWEELDGMKDARPFTIGDAKTLLARSRDKSLLGWGFAAQALPEA